MLVSYVELRIYYITTTRYKHLFMQEHTFFSDFGIEICMFGK